MNKETIKLTTTFSDRNVSKVYRNNVQWGKEGFPNSIYLDYSYEPPEKTEHIRICGKNLLSDNDAFLQKNNMIYFKELLCFTCSGSADFFGYVTLNPFLNNLVLKTTCTK